MFYYVDLMTKHQKFYIHCVKRPIGFLGALTALILLSPIFIATMILLFFANKNGFKGIFFTQERPGKNEKIFKAIKFKTMTDERDESGKLLPDAVRLTKVGKIIRSTSIDELPQLINILKGDMSIVGPRPERPEIAEQYEALMPAFSLRLQVKAGLTGLAQVYGRYNTDPRDKLKMDLMYMNQMSMMQDIRLIFATIKVLFMKESTSGVAAGQITAAGRGEEKEYAL